MKCIILCAGYATRLYPLTSDKPKSLLPIKGKPILDYIIEKVDQIEEVDEVFVVSNNKFYKNFLDWQNSRKFKKKVKTINDGTLDNESRLGGLGDLWFVIEKEKINDNLLVVLGDNFFDFDLDKVIDFFHKKNKEVVGLHDIGDLNEAKRFGVLKIQEDGKIISFVEKPEKPESTFVSTGIYVYSKDTIKKIEEYMKTDKPKDGPGNLVIYLMSLQDVYGLVLNEDWYDIGSIETYKRVNEV